ncbi:MAG: hypothetical protein U0R70_07525 [Solirubrobacteraceae bacterium]
MTSEGSPAARLRRAIANRSLVQVRSAAAEVAHVDLRDAAAILALIADAERGSYEAAAVRWLGRLALERPDIGLEEIGAALDALEDLPGDAAALVSLRALAG